MKISWNEHIKDAYTTKLGVFRACRANWKDLCCNVDVGEEAGAGGEDRAAGRGDGTPLAASVPPRVPGDL